LIIGEEAKRWLTYVISIAGVERANGTMRWESKQNIGAQSLHQDLCQDVA